MVVEEEEEFQKAFGYIFLVGFTKKRKLVTDQPTDGRTDGWTDGRTNGHMDGHTLF